MVHPSEPGDEGNSNPRESNDYLTDKKRADRSLGRRSYLKAAGAAVIGAGGFVGTGRASVDVTEEDGYEVWTISGSEVYEMDAGEVFENVLIDQRADGASFQIDASGIDGWVIQNVGFLGEGNHKGHSGFQMTVGTPAGGHGRIENVYMNQKRDGPSMSEMGGIFVRRAHSGHIDIRHTYIEGYGNNAVYGSDPGKGGSLGTVGFENCYHVDNTVGQFRIGTPGSYVRNCVGVIDDLDLTRGPYPNTTSRNTRFVFARNHPDLTVENSAFYVNPNQSMWIAGFVADHFGQSDGDECVLDVVDCDVNDGVPKLTDEAKSNESVNFQNLGNTASVDVIQDGGIPTSPRMAVRGEREMPPELPGADGGNDSGTAPELDRSLTIEGNGTVAHYEFTVSGALEHSTEGDATVNSDDSIDGSTATGGIVGGTDRYRFDGDLTDVSLDGDATILLNGQEIDPADYGDEPDGHGRDHEIVIMTTEDPSELSYEFTTTGETVPLLDNGDNSAEENNDEIVHNDDGSWTTSGYTGNGYGDTFAYDGEITDFSPTTGPLEVRIDGEVVDPATLADGSEDQGRDHEIVVTSTEDPSELSYEFTTTGEAELILGNGDNSAEENNDAIVHNDDGTCTVTGYNGNGYGDTFAYDGEITDFSPTTGPLEVRIDGDVVDPASFGGTELPNTLTIDGSSGSSTYQFSVSGDLEKSTTNDATIDGGTATGSVDSETHGFRFDGDLTDVSLDGDATILLNGQEIDPESYGLPNRIVFDGRNTDGESNYEFAVSGDLEKDPVLGSIEDDVVDGSSASGTVVDDRDGYRFSGDLVSLTLDGNANIIFQDNDGIDGNAG